MPHPHMRIPLILPIETLSTSRRGTDPGLRCRIVLARVAIAVRGAREGFGAGGVGAVVTSNGSRGSSGVSGGRAGSSGGKDTGVRVDGGGIGSRVGVGDSVVEVSASAREVVGEQSVVEWGAALEMSRNVGVQGREVIGGECAAGVNAPGVAYTLSRG